MLNFDECKAFYVLAAKGIQGFILKGNRLRFMVGGSELVQQIPGSFLEKVLEGLNLQGNKDYRVVSRAAGSARVLFRDEAKAREVAKIVPLALSEFAPGLDAVQTVQSVEGSFADLIRNAEKSLLERRQLQYADYPVPGPLVERVPRSGLPFADYCYFGGEKADKEQADRIMLAKDKSAEKLTGLAERVLPKRLQGSRARMAMDFSDIGDGDNIAIVHIDGNGLGKVIRELLEGMKKTSSTEACRAYEDFSGALDRATCEAVKSAFDQIDVKHDQKTLPYRALVCAGDDVTVVLRAADAVGFVKMFLGEFENNTRNEFSKIGSLCIETKHLTACAGIVFCKQSFPFVHAYELCESLCKYAKEKTNRQISAMAFWRQTATIADDFKDDILNRDLKGADGLTLTMMPYVLDGGNDKRYPTIGNLVELKDALGDKKMPRGSMRGILTALYQSREKAKQSFSRVRQIGHGKGYMQPVVDALKSITGNELFKDDNATPLFDALELLAAERKINPSGDDEQ